ncbi:MAG: hypothetical protein JRN37_09930 [Nitrososphaerota archaeon]|nr:hypothetical protein [Nitrososphaerota archaeon]MDG7039448.1 hypothetical protein [Nitrososphaerota archaeon]
MKRIARSAGITKRIYPHLFRHSAATRDSSIAYRVPFLALGRFQLVGLSPIAYFWISMSKRLIKS